MELLNIKEIAFKLNLKEDDIDLFGNYKAKINLNYNDFDKDDGNLILITSTSPTPYGEGKTTLSIGLNDSLNKIGKRSIVVLREPSLGPVFGVKGGATGGGLSRVEPSEDINLHFTGDFHAITSANNLLCSIIDNHIFSGNELDIDNVLFKRCLDVNDRALRNVILNNREESFNITPASEIMAIICLASNIEDLRKRLDNILVGYTKNDTKIFVSDLKCTGSLLVILKDAFKPNLVQTLYNNPAIIHGGPFANIAHGCNSLVSTKLALKLSNYVITEAGFGSDMGAIKFFDIKCRNNNIYPKVVIINTTIKSLKYNGHNELKLGIDNLKFHILNMKKFNNNIIVSLNNFPSDTLEEIKFVEEFCESLCVKFVISKMYMDGELGCIDLANTVLEVIDQEVLETQIYGLEDSITDKINKLCNLYGCRKVIINDVVSRKIKRISDLNFPICLAKTPYSISDNSSLLGYPKDFEMEITDISVQNGAGFIVVYMGNILTMPGLSKSSNYLKIDLKDNKIIGIE